MARYNEILVGRFARGVQKLFGIKGEVPVGSLAGEASVTHSFFSGVENRYLEGWERFATATNVAAGGAGNNSVVRLRNPAGSNCIMVFEKISFNNSVVMTPTFQKDPPLTADFATVNPLTNSNLDPRTRPQPTLIMSTQNTAAFSSGNTLWGGFGIANTIVDMILFEEQEIPLLPGNSYDMRESATNVNLGIAITWRERFLEESERT